MRLDKLEIGKDAVVASVDSDDAALYQHILDMGLTPGTEVTMMKHAPMGDPVEIRLRDYELTLRLADAARIGSSAMHDAHNAPARKPQRPRCIEHPAIGECVCRPRMGRALPTLPTSLCGSRLPAIRIAVRRPCSTSSPARTSMSATFPG